jgi:para-nitrobenzyl esterase
MEVEIDTPAGRLRGRRQQLGVDVFRGIPYAAPPVGPLRFRAPQPAKPWAGVRDATNVAPSPVQSGSNLFANGLPGSRVGQVSEDCLTVDVWTPAAGDGGHRPVLVWICGGAYLTGGSAVETYDGAALAAAGDLVVVSVNYRMGALGFLWLDSWDSNCGLRDQLAALRWAGENAAAFGGDPERITVFGESAGAGSILHFLPAAAREGLVKRAILQSPGVEHTQTPVEAWRVKHAVMEAAGTATEQELAELTWPAILQAQEQVLPELMAAVGAMPFHPVVDGDLVAAKPSERWDVAGVDVLMSWTAEEMRLYPDRRADDRDYLLRRIRRLIQRRTGTDPGEAAARQVAGFYDHLGSGPDMWAAVQTDALMRLPARRVALYADAAPWVAQFDWGATGSSWRKGAFHAIDLPFSFGTLDRGGWLEFLGATGDDRGAHQLAGTHMAMWSAFARTGDPGWRRFPAEVMHLDAEPWTGADPLTEAAALWEPLWSVAGPPV